METKIEHKPSSDELLTRRELLTICAQLSVAGVVVASVAEVASASVHLPASVGLGVSRPMQAMNTAVLPQRVTPVLSLAEYVRSGLLHTSMVQVVIQPGVSVRGLCMLRMAGIQTALDLDTHPTIPGILPTEWQIMKAWCDVLKSRFTAEYHAGRDLPYSMISGCNPTWDGSRPTTDAPNWWTHDDAEGKQI